MLLMLSELSFPFLSLLYQESLILWQVLVFLNSQSAMKLIVITATFWSAD